MSMLRLLLRQQRLLQQACVTQTWWPAATASAGLQVQQRYCNIPESEDVGELEFFSEPPETQLTSGALRPDSSSKASSSGFAPPAAGTANAQPPHNSSSSTRQLSKLHQAESAVLTLQQKRLEAQSVMMTIQHMTEGGWQPPAGAAAAAGASRAGGLQHGSAGRQPSAGQSSGEHSTTVASLLQQLTTKDLPAARRVDRKQEKRLQQQLDESVQQLKQQGLLPAEGEWIEQFGREIDAMHKDMGAVRREAKEQARLLKQQPQEGQEVLQEATGAGASSSSGGKSLRQSAASEAQPADAAGSSSLATIDQQLKEVSASSAQYLKAYEGARLAALQKLKKAALQPVAESRWQVFSDAVASTWSDDYPEPDAEADQKAFMAVVTSVLQAPAGVVDRLQQGFVSFLATDGLEGSPGQLTHESRGEAQEPVQQQQGSQQGLDFVTAQQLLEEHFRDAVDVVYRREPRKSWSKKALIEHILEWERPRLHALFTLAAAGKVATQAAQQAEDRAKAAAAAAKQGEAGEEPAQQPVPQVQALTQQPSTAPVPQQLQQRRRLRRMRQQEQQQEQEKQQGQDGGPLVAQLGGPASSSRPAVVVAAAAAAGQAGLTGSSSGSSSSAAAGQAAGGPLGTPGQQATDVSAVVAKSMQEYGAERRAALEKQLKAQLLALSMRMTRAFDKGLASAGSESPDSLVLDPCDHKCLTVFAAGLLDPAFLADPSRPIIAIRLAATTGSMWGAAWHRGGPDAIMAWQEPPSPALGAAKMEKREEDQHDAARQIARHNWRRKSWTKGKLIEYILTLERPALKLCLTAAA